MINSANQIQDSKIPISNLRYNKISPNNICINKSPSILNRNIRNNLSLSKNDNKRQRPLLNSANTKKLENKSVDANLNQFNLIQKNVFLHLNEYNNNNILTPKINKQKKLLIKNKSVNIIMPKLNLLKKNISKDENRFYYLGRDFSFNNKYYSDLINENYKSNEKEDMESADIKIEQLAKDLNLFQNKKIYNNFRLNFDSLNKNKISEDEYNNILPAINSDNTNIVHSNSQSRLSSGTPRSRLYSGKFTNHTEIYGNNRYLNKPKVNRLSSPSFLIERYNIEGTNVMSPLCEKAREIFLYKKIFYYFGGKKIPKIMKKFINNKYNLCYAENEKQFEKKLIGINESNRKKGKLVYHKVGKAETEERAASLQHRVEFIKKIFDYAYPDILIYKIKNKSEMDKKEIKENKLKMLNRARELKEKLKIKRYKNSLVHDSIIIKKIK